MYCTRVRCLYRFVLGNLFPASPYTPTVVNNSRKYNLPDTQYYRAADKMEKKFMVFLHQVKLVANE